jgi:hypothetical protein
MCYVFIFIYLTTFSVANSYTASHDGWIMNNELQGISKEAVLPHSFVVTTEIHRLLTEGFFQNLYGRSQIESIHSKSILKVSNDGVLHLEESCLWNLSIV